jgi:pyruvate/2-oxoglutarate dehydrogenase complex dihydrolipoamide dehydrogenase (E3) component
MEMLISTQQTSDLFRATLSGLPDRVYMKVIVCASMNKVLGVHMCGEDAPEIIQVCVFLTAKKRFVFFLSFQASDS